jgi:hypothetical protein
MRVKTDITPDDHQAFTRHIWYSGARGSWLWFVMIFVGVVALSAMLEANAGIHLDTATMLVTMVILTGYLALAQRRIRPPSGRCVARPSYVRAHDGRLVGALALL